MGEVVAAVDQCLLDIWGLGGDAIFCAIRLFALLAVREGLALPIVVAFGEAILFAPRPAYPARVLYRALQHCPALPAPVPGAGLVAAALPLSHTFYGLDPADFCSAEWTILDAGNRMAILHAPTAYRPELPLLCQAPGQLPVAQAY